MDRKKVPVIVIIVLLVVVAAVVIGTVLMTGSSYSKEKMDLDECFGSCTENEAAIVLNGRLLEEKAVCKDGEIYLPYELVSSFAGNPFYYEPSSGRLYLTLQKENNIWTEKDDPAILASAADGTMCVSASVVEKYAEADVEQFEEPARAVIRSVWTDVVLAEVLEDTQIRFEGSKKSPIVAEVFAGDTLTLIEEAEEGWCMVTAADGCSGYIEEEKIGIGEAADLPHERNMLTAFDTLQMDGIIKMVWHYVDVQENNDILDYMLEDTSGINVICPTWLTIADKKGNINSLADREYVANIRKRGMKIWTMLSDYLGGDASTGDILMDPVSRKNLTDQVLAVVKEYQLDGLNIDLETITEEQAPAYLQFLRELKIRTHEMGVILSVDNYVPLYTSYYDRTQQAKIVDYLIIMGYDETTEYSEEPGSVASLPFVKDGIERTLKEVPAKQVILGVPFYTRSWTQPFGTELFETDALSMPRAREFIAEHGIDLAWDAKLGQYTGSSTDDAARYSIWMEDAESLEKKLQLVNDYGLSGASAWRLGLEENAVWKVWNSKLK